MTTFRGVEQSAILKSLNDLLDYIEEKNPGPLTAQTIAAWRATDGFLDRLARADSTAAIAHVIKDASSHYDHELPDGGPRLNHWMGAFYDYLLPQLERHAARTGDRDAIIRQRALIQAVFDWDGFNQGAPLGSLSQAAHELMNYARDTLGARPDDLFQRYRDGFFMPPYRTYTAVYGAAADFNRAARALNDLAVAHGLADHVQSIAETRQGVSMSVTPQFAEIILTAPVSAFPEGCAPGGLMKAGVFTPATPQP